ncbi:MAG TPA: hypothetical protein VIR55_05445 [Ignavibacteria bacterium]
MLKYAHIYKEELQEKYCEIILDDDYKYYNNCSWWENEIELSEDTWDSIDFVSVDESNNVLGFMSAEISRGNDKISCIAVLNFSKKGNYTFSKDLYKFLIDLFTKYNIRKIEYTVNVGNPIEKMFDKYTEKYGGRIIGVTKESIKLHDNKYYDSKKYEMFKEDFLRSYKHE